VTAAPPLRGTTMMAAPTRGVVTGVAVALVAAGVYLGQGAAAAAVAAIAVVYGFGWPRLVSVPSRRGSAIVIVGAGLAATVAGWITGEVAWLAIVVAAGVIASFVHQMMRRDGRPRLFETVSATVTGVVVVASGVGWLTAATTPGGLEVVLVTAACLLSAAMMTIIPASGAVVASAAAVAAGAVGALVGSVLPTVGIVPGLLLGVAGGGVMALSHLMFNQFPASGYRRAALAAALMPVATLGGPVHLLAGLLG